MSPVNFVLTSDSGSNKPENHSVQLSAQAYSYERPGGYTVSIMKPVVDRLSITLSVPEVSHQKNIEASFKSLSSSVQMHEVSVWKKTKNWGSGKYASSYRLQVGQYGDVLVQLGAKGAKVAFIRLELNPNLLGKAGVKALWASLTKITEGIVTHKKVAHEGRVTRLDVAVDLINIDIEDVLIRSQKDGVTVNYFSLTGKAETSYLNQTSKGSKLYVYDKNALIEKKLAAGAEVENVYEGTKYTRVEVRTSTTKPLAKLEGLKNPLLRIDLKDIEAVEPPEEVYHWKLFQDSCRYRGLNAALKQLPEAVREKYVEAIHLPDIKVWRPVDIWSFWPEVLNRSGLLLEDNEGEKGQMV